MNETGPRASWRGYEVADRVPPSRRSRIVVRVLVAIVLLTLTAMAVRATHWWGCNFTPRDQAAAVAAYQDSQGDAGGAFLWYCKAINGMTTRLEVTSLADGTADHLATFIVLIDGRPDADC